MLGTEPGSSARAASAGVCWLSGPPLCLVLFEEESLSLGLQIRLAWLASEPSALLSASLALALPTRTTMQVPHGWVLGIDLWPSCLRRSTLLATLSVWYMCYILMAWQSEEETEWIWSWSACLPAVTLRTAVLAVPAGIMEDSRCYEGHFCDGPQRLPEDWVIVYCPAVLDFWPAS